MPTIDRRGHLHAVDGKYAEKPQGAAGFDLSGPAAPAATRPALTLVEPARPSVKESTAALRGDLRGRFKDTKFTVRMDSGSAHGWVAVSWQDGPREADVRDIGFGYQGTKFDGQDDSYHQVNTDAAVRHSLRGVNTHRSMGPAGVAAVDEVFRRAGIGDYAKAAGDGTRLPGDSGYDDSRFLTEHEQARLGLPVFLAAYRPTAMTAAHYIHAHTDFTSGEPVYSDD